MNNTQLGIVSPCSTCKNQRYLSKMGEPMNACPRRSWQNEYLYDIAGTTDQQASGSQIVQLALTGNSNPPSLTSPLNNPVYDSDSQSVLVWTALYMINRAIRDNVSGAVVNPGLNEGLDVFDTNYIQCELMPYSPNTDEHGYFLNGAFKEGDPIQVSMNRNQYEDGGMSLKKIAGSVQRSSITGTIPRNPTLSDNAAAGT
jgi:hypothetical protein